jgi:protein-L-isoaspartate(D-aspartate) O-methyltransferase
MDEIEKMVEHQLLDRGITDPGVLKAMKETDRRLFIPDQIRHLAYSDSALPIGRGQTISQPYIVAYMAQMLQIQPQDRILEIGSGCGYNAAVLSKLAAKVYTIEIIEWLARLAKYNLTRNGITNVVLRLGDGYKGWEEEAPFDRVILTAAPYKIPLPLKEQLREGGKLIAPVKTLVQKLILLEKTPEGKFTRNDLIPVRFVPMTGKSQLDED